MYKKIIIAFILCVMLAACSNTKDNNTQNNDQPNGNENTRPIHYQSNDEKVNPDNANDSRQADDPKHYSDAFTNEESIQLSKELGNRRGINQAQVASTDDRVIVSIMLTDPKDRREADRLRKELRTKFPDKQIVIYTDDTHWERMKDIHTRIESKNFGNDILDFFKKDKKD